MEVVDVPEPGPAARGQVVVRPEAIGICGSDFHYFHGDLGSVGDERALPAHPGPRVLRDRRGRRARVPAVARRRSARRRLARDRLRKLPRLPARARQRLRAHRPDRHPPRRRAPGAALDPGLASVPGDGHRRPAVGLHRADVDRGAHGGARARRGRRARARTRRGPDRAGRRDRRPRPRRVGADGRPHRGEARARERVRRRPRSPRARRRSRRPRARMGRRRAAGGRRRGDRARRSRCAPRSPPSRRRAACSSSASRPTTCRCPSAPCRSASSTCSASAPAARRTSPRPPSSSRAGGDAVEPLISHEYSLEEAPAAIAFAIANPAEAMKVLVHTG